MKPTYLQSVLDKIENKNARAEIGEELESHLLDKRDYYMELGYSEDEATRRAEEEMGDPDDCAVPMNGLYQKQGKTPLRIISLLFLLVFLAAAIFTPNIFCYGSEHLLAVFHSIGIDLLSTGFIAGFAVILLQAHRKKDKIVAAGVMVCLMAYLVISLINGETQSLFGLLQPAVFAVFTLFAKGFGGYADRVFAYQYTPWEDKGVFVIGAAVIFAVLFLWAASVFVTVHLQERMINTRILQKIFKAVRAVVGVLFCANMILIAAGVTVAAVDLPNKQAAAEAEKREIINCILDSSGWQDFERLEKLNQAYIPYYITENQGLTLSQSYRREPAANNTILYSGDQNLMASYGFSLTNFNTDLPLLSRDVRLSENEMRQLSNVNTLGDFKKLGWYDKAVSVMRTQAPSGNGDMPPGVITFVFLADGNSTKTLTFIQENEKDFSYIGQEDPT